MKLVSLLLLAIGLYGQNAVQNNFSPTVQGVTIGTVHCYFWFHSSSLPPWDVEVACYSGTSIQSIQVGSLGQTLQQAFVSSTGTIGWLITSTNGVLNYQITGRGSSDTSDLLFKGSI